MTVLYIIICIVICAVIYLAGFCSGTKYYLEASKEYNEIIENLMGIIDKYKEIVATQNDQIGRLFALPARLLKGENDE